MTIKSKIMIVNVWYIFNLLISFPHNIILNIVIFIRNLKKNNLRRLDQSSMRNLRHLKTL